MKFVDSIKTAASKVDVEKTLRFVSVALTLTGLAVSNKLQGIDHEKTKAELKSEILEELSSKN